MKAEMTNSIEVGILAFDRPRQLERCLLSVLRDQQLPAELSVRVTVLDNHPELSSRGLVNDLARRYPTLRYIPWGRRNIASGRNEVVRQAAAPYLAFIDDDEWASPGWLVGMMATAQRYQAHAVLGAVEFDYGPNPSWAQRTRIHDIPNPETGAVTGFYSNTANCLFQVQFLRQKGITFPLDYGISGGSDAHVMFQLRREKAHIVWSREAQVWAAAEPRRSTLRRALVHQVRAGGCYARLLETFQPGSLPRLLQRRRKELRSKCGGAFREWWHARFQTPADGELVRALGLTVGAHWYAWFRVIYAEYASPPRFLKETTLDQLAREQANLATESPPQRAAG